MNEPHIEALKAYLKEDEGLTNPELAQRLMDDFKVKIDPSQISRVLIKHGITRKSRRPPQCARSAR